MPIRDYYETIEKDGMREWQKQWTEIEDNKLKQVKEEVEEWDTSHSSDRRREVKLARLRIGHTNITHSYLITKDDPPTCEQCYEPLTVKHIIVECPGYTNLRRRHLKGNATMLKALRNDENTINGLFRYLEEIRMIDRI
jgi:hypothetical protein